MPYEDKAQQNAASVRNAQKRRFKGRTCQICGENPGNVHRASLEVRAIAICDSCRAKLRLQPVGS